MDSRYGNYRRGVVVFVSWGRGHLRIPICLALGGKASSNIAVRREMFHFE